MSIERTPVDSTEESTSYSHPPPNLPCGDLLGNRDDYNKICVPLYNAIMKGDWEAASVILSEHQDLDLLGFAITENYDTMLHIAASAESSRSMEKFVEKLVNKMTKEQLELQNKNYKTALCLAASAGHVRIVKTMVEKNRALLNIPATQGLMPLCITSSLGQSNEMVHFLYDNSNKMTGDFWTEQNRSLVLQNCVQVNLFDVALKIVIDRPELTTDKKVLGLLAQKTDAFGLIKPPFLWRAMHQINCCMKVGPTETPSAAMQLLRIICRNIMQLPKDKIDDIMGNVINEQIPTQLHSLQPLFVAAETGNTEFVVEFIREYPDLLWKRNDDNQTIFHVAVLHRHVDIYNLLHEIRSMKDMITSVVDNNGNNMLHLVGMIANQNEPLGVRQQMQHMQRELLWFKEVKDMIPPSYREMKNKDGQTPYELFKRERGYILSENEKWMKDTANQCLVVAALIATIGCTLAFAVPGGYNQNDGMPMFLHKMPFIVFSIFNVISIVFCFYSILVFLSIFVARYTANNFLETLPKRLLIGLASLFFSISNMGLALLAAFFSIWKDKLIWVLLFLVILNIMPAISYWRMEYYLLRDVYRWTYGSRNPFKPQKLRLYHQNPRL